MTQVRTEVKFVRNLQNYESVHVTVGLEDSVRQGESVDDAYKRLFSKVESTLENKINEIDEDRK